MNNLTLLLLGLVLIYIPQCLSQNNDKQCFSQTLKPSYPCCTGNKVVYTDKNGDWGVENDKWCGIGNGTSKSSDHYCFSILLGYNCCKECKVLFTDENGDWGVENNKWCGIKSSCTSTAENEVQSDIMEEPAFNTTNISIDDINDFDFLFLKMENNKKNLMYSPLSLKYALKMLVEGADKNTYDELNKLLRNVNLSNYEKYQHNGLLILNPKNITIGNDFYIKDRYYNMTEEEYPKLLKDKYVAHVTNDNFLLPNYEDWHGLNFTEPTTIILLRNSFSDNENTVQEEITDNYLNIMNNIIIFGLQFLYPFDSYTPYLFNKEDGQISNASALITTEVSNENIAYYKDNDITVFSKDLLNYDGIQLEFMAIMPEKEILSDFVKKISKEQINKIDSKLKLSYDEQYNLQIVLPKFKFGNTLNLKENLKKLGIKDSFNDTIADFSKIKSKNKLYVTEIYHSDYIDFSIKSLKIKSIDDTSPVEANINYPTVLIEINKPYMFIIRDKNTKDIWHIGTIYEPISPLEDTIWPPYQSGFRLDI